MTCDPNFQVNLQPQANDIEHDIMKLANDYPCNVLTEEVFQKSIRDIFHLLAKIVGKTVGPYGGATMIEEMGDYHMTKDGWTVLKFIHFNNRKDNTILNLIRMISHQMVMKVGDGSTTAILAAHEFLDLMSSNPILSGMRPKDIQDCIREYVDILCERIQANAVQVTDDNYVDIVENVARIATNGNEEYTGFLKEIYEKSGRDTSISKRMSLTEKAHYDIMDDMFYIAGKAIDNVYFNDENSKCNIAHPHILLFNFTLGNEHWDLVRLAYNYMQRVDATGRMVVIAPNYDQFFIDHVKSDAQNFIQLYSQQGNGGAIPFPIVFAKNPYYAHVERIIFEDLAPFLGTTIVNPLEAEGLVKGVTEYYKVNGTYQRAVDASKEAMAAFNKMVQNAVNTGKDPRSIERPNVVIPDDDGMGLRTELEDKIGKFFGTCEIISIGSENIEFHGFNNINQPMVDAHIRDAQDQYKRELDEIENARYITKTYVEARDRLARIACKSAMIHVGGHSNLEKKLNDDALDDAIHACRSTISYGYNLGNNLAIFKAIKETAHDGTLKDNAAMNSVAEIMYKAFTNVIYRIHQNKNPKETITHTNGIIEKSLAENKCYDLNTDEYSDKIINSCRTDIEILRSAITIIGTILSANQYVAVDIMDQKKALEESQKVR